MKKRKLHGKITEEVYKKEVDRITYRDENNKKVKSKVKSNKKKYIIIMIIFILIGFILLLYINRYYLFGREYVYVDNLYNLKDPIQEKASGTKKITIDGESIFISRLYSYKIQARVIDTKQYIGFDLLNKLSPEDMGLAWDFMVEDRNIYKIGDLKENSMEAIWNGEKRKKLKEKLLNSELSCKTKCDEANCQFNYCYFKQRGE